jgi:hypothetical protein
MLDRRACVRVALDADAGQQGDAVAVRLAQRVLGAAADRDDEACPVDVSHHGQRSRAG